MSAALACWSGFERAEPEMAAAGRALLGDACEAAIGFLATASARRHVQAAIRFGASRQADPIYRLWMATCMDGYRASVGRPDTRPVRRWWHATRP